MPILYYVDRLREGRSYSTRSVRAVQKGKVIFIMMCSFHKPEPQHPSHQWTIPASLPKPEDVEIDLDFYHRKMNVDPIDPRMKAILEEIIQVWVYHKCKVSLKPIEQKHDLQSSIHHFSGRDWEALNMLIRLQIEILFCHVSLYSSEGSFIKDLYVNYFTAGSINKPYSKHYCYGEQGARRNAYTRTLYESAQYSEV